MLRIRNWKTVFENSRSLDIKNLAWVPVPNRHDGTSYRELMAMPGGPGLFGAWVLLVQVASRAPFPRDGRLVRGNGKPHDARSLYAATGCPEAVFAELLPMLVGDDFGWVEDVSDVTCVEKSTESTNHGISPPQGAVSLPQETPTPPFVASSHTRAELNGTERNGILPPYPQEFLDLLSEYPAVRGGRGKILKSEREIKAFFSMWTADRAYPYLAAFAIERQAGDNARNLGTFVANRLAITPDMLRLQARLEAEKAPKTDSRPKADPTTPDNPQWENQGRFEELTRLSLQPGFRDDERTEFETLKTEYLALTAA